MSIHTRFSRILKSLAAAACAGALVLAPAAQAAPVLYNFTTSVGFANPSDSIAVNALAALGPNATVSGSFWYDSASPAVGTGNGGVTIYGNAANVVPSYFGLSGTAGSFSFTDPRGFVTVGNNPDIIQLYSDSALFGGTHNFAGFSLGGVGVVNLRMVWAVGMPGVTDFLPNQNLPGILPAFAGSLALDLGVTNSATLISEHAITFSNLVVRAAEVPEPQTLVLTLAGLGLVALTLRRKAKSQRPGMQTVRLSAA